MCLHSQGDDKQRDLSDEHIRGLALAVFERGSSSHFVPDAVEPPGVPAMEATTFEIIGFHIDLIGF